jgi:hypothetical protein
MATTASTRTGDKNSVKPTGGTQAARATNRDAVSELIAHGAQIQLASITAASKFFADWAQSADRYAQAISDELLGRLHGETNSSELVGRIATLSNQHLRDVTALPNAAVSRFNKELAKTPTSRTRTRR